MKLLIAGRLALEELVAHNLTLQDLRQLQQAEGAPRLVEGDALLDEFLGKLPFTPTGAQRRVIDEIGDLPDKQAE